VSADYFSVLHARVVAGRAFDARDAAGAPQVAVVNQAFVRRWLGGENPIGRRIDFSWDTKGMQTIVGVIADMKEGPLDQPTMPAVYVPLAQRPSDAMFILARSRGEQNALIPALGRAVQGADRDLPLQSVRTMDEIVASAVADQRMSAAVVATFALLALVLGAIGLYGVVGYAVQQRRQEIGVRAALGASRGALVWLILSQGLRYAIVGVVLGTVGALASGRVLASRLFGITPFDPPTLVTVGAFLALVALVASAVPAIRAARVDPLIAMRDA
jgi:predicted permease